MADLGQEEKCYCVGIGLGKPGCTLNLGNKILLQEMKIREKGGATAKYSKASDDKHRKPKVLTTFFASSYLPLRPVFRNLRSPRVKGMAKARKT